MITAADLKAAGNQLLKQKYPDMKIYGVASIEQLERPCFFTEILPFGLKYESKNWAQNSASFKITLIQEEPDEFRQYQFAEEIRNLFGLKLAVGDRKINVVWYGYDQIGEHHDMLQVTVKFEWYENMYEPESAELMENLEVHTTQEGE